MKYSVGYQITQENGYIDTIIDFKDRINEVYFSWEDFPNGRNTDIRKNGLSVFEAREKRDSDFKRISKSGIKFNLLLNGNCYGKYTMSRAFYNKIGETAEYLENLYGLSAVTTTSPLIAKFIKQNFPDIEVRASVNMEIGTTEGMDYIADLFDSFYLKREYNRDIKRIKQVKKWCEDNKKGLYGLANSGCLKFCSVHTFHDNAVSHESEISEMDNAYAFEGQCMSYLKNPKKRDDWLRLTSFIRPEDVFLYEGLFDGLKLATRMNKNPSAVLRAYFSGSFAGSLPLLLEPDHSALFYPAIIENKKIPQEFAQTVLNCRKNCGECSYCADVQKGASVTLK